MDIPLPSARILDTPVSNECAMAQLNLANMKSKIVSETQPYLSRESLKAPFDLVGYLGLLTT
jgi:hypothetical protein